MTLLLLLGAQSSGLAVPPAVVRITAQPLPRPIARPNFSRPGRIIEGITPTAEIVREFEADLVRTLCWVDIYESDNQTPWKTRVDSGRDARRNIDLVLVDFDNSIDYGPGGLWYDKIIKPYRGITLSSGDAWVAKLGEFMIDSVSRPSFPREFKITGQDFTKKLKLDEFAETTTFAAGLRVVDVIRAIATNGGVTNFEFTSSSVMLSTAATFEAGTSRFDACKTLAESSVATHPRAEVNR